MKFLAKLGSISGLVVAGLLLYATSAQAATFTVTSTADDAAVDPNVGCATVLPDCTLRSAIEAANTQAGADTIEFDIAGAGVHTFTPASAYDTIAEQVTIDGSTQDGASCGTLVPSSLPATSNTPHTLLIEIDGTNIGGGNNLSFSSGSDNSIVRGLVVNNAQGGSTGLNLNANQITAECNYVGTNASGTAAGASNGGIGIATGGDSITIQNNLISGNDQAGIEVSGNDSATTLVSNNIIGLTADGLSALPNAGMGIAAIQYVNVNHNIVSGNTTHGVFIFSNEIAVTGNYIGVSMNGSAMGNGGNGIATGRGSFGYQVGGAAAGEGNVISANAGHGIDITNQSGAACPSNTFSETYGNMIGTNTSGGAQTGFGNGGSGISANETVGNDCVMSVYKHQIGGSNSGEPNIIAGNAVDGVRVYQYINPQDAGDHTDVFSISVVQNSIFGNGNLGINLATATTPTGAADADVGPNGLNSFVIDYPASYANNYLNRPTINSTSFSGNELTVNYTFQAPPSITEDPPALQASNLVGYRLDFYVNDAGQDGAYAGYSQGKNHIGSFVVDGSESGATHAFTSPVTLSNGQTITATATILWQIEECPSQVGSGPPYSGCE